MSELTRTSLQLFRDCLRLAAYIAPRSTRKYDAMRSMIVTQFRANRHETDPKRIQLMKEDAIRALTNYLMYNGLAKSNPEVFAADPGDGSSDHNDPSMKESADSANR